MENSKFIIEFDPLANGAGQFLIKEHNEVKTPYASVFISIGICPVKAKQNALFKAETIVKALNEYYECLQVCVSCDKHFEIETMKTDTDFNYFCIECANELFPIMQKDYEEMFANGEIDEE